MLSLGGPTFKEKTKIKSDFALFTVLKKSDDFHWINHACIREITRGSIMCHYLMPSNDLIYDWIK